MRIYYNYKHIDPNNEAPKYMKQKLTELEEVENLISGDFDNSFNNS